MRFRVQAALRAHGLVFVDQLVSSGTNALAVLLAAYVLRASELNTYVLLQLVGTTLIALQRALVLEPSLSLNTSTHRADVSTRWILWFWTPAAVVGGVVGYALWGNPLGVFASASLVLPGVQDLLRYRAFGLNRIPRALVSDLIWLVVFVSLALGMMGAQLSSTLLLVCTWTIGAGLGAIALLVRHDSRTRHSFAEIFRRGKYQITEWAIGTATSTIPLFIAQAVVPISSVGAFRLAQTLTGPLNTISSSVTVRYLIDASSISELSAEESKRYVRRSNFVLVALSGAYAIVMIVLFLLFGNLIHSEARASLAYALPLTLISTVITSPVTSYASYAKAVGMQKRAIAPRLAVLIANAATTALGVYCYLNWKFDPLVLPVGVTAVTLFVVWRIAFMRIVDKRRVRSNPDRPVDITEERPAPLIPGRSID